MSARIKKLSLVERNLVLSYSRRFKEYEIEGRRYLGAPKRQRGYATDVSSDVLSRMGKLNR